jgi:hypothetical protein
VKALSFADTLRCFPLRAEEGGASGLHAAAAAAAKRSHKQLESGGPTN